MLYVISKSNDPGLVYTDGQDPIIHLDADLGDTVDWADANAKRWAFTLSNAGTTYFEDRCDLGRLDEIDWEAVQSRRWVSQKEGKQAEFLVEDLFPWALVSRIGVLSSAIHSQVSATIATAEHKPPIEIKRDWYY